MILDDLDRSLAVAQARRTQADLRAFGRAIGNLPIKQECEPFGVGETPGGILLLEFEEGVGHAVELQRSELVARVGGVSVAACLLNGRRCGRRCCRK
jgi:hypothetical protein